MMSCDLVGVENHGTDAEVVEDDCHLAGDDNFHDLDHVELLMVRFVHLMKMVKSRWHL